MDSVEETASELDIEIAEMDCENILVVAAVEPSKNIDVSVDDSTVLIVEAVDVSREDVLVFEV